MYDLLARELETLDIVAEGGDYLLRGESISRDKLVEKTQKQVQKRKKLLWTMWHEVASELSSVVTDSSPSNAIRKLFVPALQDLYDLACCFEELSDCQISKILRSALDRDVESFSSVSMSRVVDYAMSIGWLNHLIRKDLYSLALISKMQEMRQTEAIGVAGPWSRTDIPMRERVFRWDEISGEVAGRAMDKRKQRRYRMGLEQYKDPWPNEGFYWREIRNEPYSFGDESANPYPSRNVLRR